MFSHKPTRLCAVLAAVLGALVLSAPAGASAASKSKPVSLKVVNAIKKTVSKVVKDIGAIDSQIATINGKIATINGKIATINTSITTINGQNAQTQTQLANLNTTVQDASTGVPGLNTARPLVGTVLATTGECTAAYGTATTGPCAGPGSEFTLTRSSTGLYLLHFVRSGAAVDVSKRVFTATPLNAVAFTSADSCVVDSGRCSATAGSTDASPDDALIGTAAGNGNPLNITVQVAAIAG